MEIKDEAGPSRLNVEEKDKGKMVNVITLERVEQEEACCDAP